MIVYKREIVFFIIAALAAMSAVWYFFGNIKEEKLAMRTDLYSLFIPTPDAVLVVNKPSLFGKIILAQQPIYNTFRSKIPEIYLSLIRENTEISSFLYLYYPQGTIFYAKINDQHIHSIEKIINTTFHSFAPQKQKKGTITYVYYPDSGNRFFGYYYHKGIWVASYSKKLLEETASRQLSGTASLSSELTEIRKQFDANAPLNLAIQSKSLNLSITQNDSILWKIPDQWLAVDLFYHEGNICYFSSLPYQETADTLYAKITDTLSVRLHTLFPQLDIKTQFTRERTNIYFTGCNAPN